jgi:4'-phosphopantetheinyl transferase
MDRKPIDLYLLKIDDHLPDYQVQYLLKYISRERAKRIQVTLKKGQIVQSLLSELLLRYLIIRRLGVKNHSISFNYSKNGKPFLKGAPDFFFNISHSSEYIAIVLHHSEIGVDIEKNTTIDFFKIVNRFFNKNEIANLLKEPENKQQGYFYRLFTSKESYLKARGKSILELKGAVDISGLPPLGEVGRYYFTDFSKTAFFTQYLNEEYILTVCSFSRKKCEMKEIKKESLLDYFLSGNI